MSRLFKQADIDFINELIDKKLGACQKVHKEILEDAKDGVLKDKNIDKVKKVLKDK